MQATTEMVMEDLVQDSPFFGNTSQRRIIPSFKPHEVLSGVELGYGEFGVVFEASKLCLDETTCDCQDMLAGGSVPLETLLPEVGVCAPTSDEDNVKEEPEQINPPPEYIFGKDCASSIEEETTTTTTTTTATSVSTPFTDTMSSTISAPDEHSPTREENEEAETQENTEEYILAKNNTRASMAAHTHRDGTARYAIKRLKANILDQEVRMAAAIDLACEAMFLQSITHSNIIHLRGTVGLPGTPNFAILMDRLVMTLEDKIVQWKAEQKIHKGKFFGLVGKQSDILDEHMTDRLFACFDIARAMRHLHSRKILYRYVWELISTRRFAVHHGLAC